MTDIKKKTPSKFVNGKYVNVYNPWPLSLSKGVKNFGKWVWRLTFLQPPKLDYSKQLTVYTPSFVNDENESTGNIQATWLGHASVYVEMEGVRVLFDPVFSNSLSKVGPTRYRPCPVQAKDIHQLDAVVISHNHYDHMDDSTIHELGLRFPDLQWFVPMGDRSNLETMLQRKSEKIKEMDWWGEEKINSGDNSLTLAFTPSQHWSNRGILDTFKSLWGSYALIGSKSRFWFGGDTGYCLAFKEIGDAYGPFDCAAIPIGAYEPRKMMKYQHVNPEEAVQIHKDIKSRLSFGIHWGTFVLTEEAQLAPRETLQSIVKKSQEDSADNAENKAANCALDFITINHGETLVIDGDKELSIIRGDKHPKN